MSFRILKKTEDKYTPVFLNMSLAEKYNPINPMPPMNYDWVRAKGGKKSNYPKELYLITKEDYRFLFDFYFYFNGFIISKELLDVFHSSSSCNHIQSVPLITVNYSGKRNTDKQYYFVRFIDLFFVIDYEKSEFTFQMFADKDLARRTGYGIKEFKNLVFKDIKSDQPFFQAIDPILCNSIIVTSEFAEKLASFDFIGYDIVTLNEYVKYNESKYGI